MLLSLLLLAGISLGRGPTAAGEVPADLARYAGSYDTDALLGEPIVRAELAALAGGRLPHLLRNLDVRGAIDLIGGLLSIAGNAPHGGGEEEAVVCVAVSRGAVHAALRSGGTVAVFTRTARYEDLPLCIKDWITLANAGHADRLERPPNVEMSAATP